MPYSPPVSREMGERARRLDHLRAAAEHRIVDAARNVVANPRDHIYHVALQARIRELDELLVAVDRRARADATPHATPSPE